MSKQNELLPIKSESLSKTEILEKYSYLYDLMIDKLNKLIEEERLKQYKK